MTPRPVSSAIILAAGRGVRARPLTDQFPKALLPVVDRPIIGWILDRLRRSSIRRIGVNLCHKAPAIKCYLAADPDLRIVVERTPHDTGAPLAYFREIITGDFLVHNCDFISDIDIRSAIDYHQRHRALVTWVLVKNPGTNLVGLEGDRITALHGRSDRRRWTFTGLAVYSERLFDYFPDRAASFSIKEPIRHALQERETVLGFRWRGYWREIGTPGSYWRLHAELLHRSGPYVSPASRVRTDRLSGFYSIGAGCYLGPGVRLRDTVVLPGTRLDSGSYSSCVVGRHFVWRYHDRS